MVQLAEIYQGLHLNNDRDSDLVTGTVLPIRFYELVKKELQYAKRAESSLTLVSFGFKLSDKSALILEKFDISKVESEYLISEILDLLMKTAFKAENSLRSNESISRIGALTFCILIREGESAAQILISRLMPILEKALFQFSINLKEKKITFFDLEVFSASITRSGGTTLEELLDGLEI